MDIFNERMPFLVAAAVLRVIRQKTNLSDENAAWDAFISWKGREQKEYLDTIFQTRHSIFYHQLQELYEHLFHRLQL